MKTKNLLLVVASLGIVIGVAVWSKQRLVQQPVPPGDRISKLPPWEEPWKKPDVKPPMDFTVDQALQSINEAEIKQNLYYLASPDIEGKMSGKRGNIVAFDFLKQKYESYGLQTEYQRFKINRVNPGPKNEQGDDYTQNIFAWIEGSDPRLKDEIVVVGAHADHIGYGPSMSQSPSRREIHPGADDNASGTAALLSIAKAFSMLKGKVRRTVVFQSYSAEEMGLIGSRYYCENPIFPRGKPDIRKHVAMLNMDMIGYLGKTTYYKANFQLTESSIDLNRYVNELSGKYSFAKRIASRGGGGSDHASFYNKKVPVVCLHTGMHRNYHTPDDTADKINYKGMEDITRYMFELAYRVAQAEAAPSFNHAGYRPMPYDHDHDYMPFKE